MSWPNLVFVVLLWPLIGSQKSPAFNFNAYSSDFISENFLLVVVVLFVDQVRDQFIQSMRNSDPRVRIVFVYRFNANFHSLFTLQTTGCNFQYGPNFGIPSNPTFRVSWIFISWQSVLTTCHWFCKLWELFSVFRHEILSDFNNSQESCIRTKLLNVSCCDNFSIRSPYLCNSNSLCVGSSLFKRTFVLITFGTNEELDCSPTTGSSRVIWFIFFTRFCDCTVKTELIYRSNCAKNSCNRITFGLEV